MGGDDPIANPAGIRFMSPEESASLSAAMGNPVPSLFSALGAVGLVDLGLSAATLGVSLATLQSVRRVEDKIDSLWMQVELQQSQLQSMTQQLSRIDCNVAEQNLRSALAHLLPRASTDDGFNITVLESLHDDLDKFTDSIDTFGFGLAANLRLSTDVKAMLTAVWHLVYGAQLTWIAAHNQALAGDPERVQQHPFQQELLELFSSLPLAAIDRLHISRVLDGVARELGDLVYNQFMFAGDEQRRKFGEWIEGRALDPVLTVLGSTFPLASALAAELDHVLPDIETESDLNSIHEWILNYLAAWLLTDAGLVYRTMRCLALQRSSEAWSAFNLDGPGTVAFILDINRALETVA